MEVDRNTSRNSERMFTVKKWNAVAMWSWDVDCDTCAICRVQVMGRLVDVIMITDMLISDVMTQSWPWAWTCKYVKMCVSDSLSIALVESNSMAKTKYLTQILNWLRPRPSRLRHFILSNNIIDSIERPCL